MLKIKKKEENKKYSMSHLNKSVKIFIWWTLISVIVTLTLKSILVGHIFQSKLDVAENIKNIDGLVLKYGENTTLDSIPNGRELAHNLGSAITSTLAEIQDKMDTIQKDNKLGVITQTSILVISILFYGLEMFKIFKYVSKRNNVTKKDWKIFMIENIVFLIVFLIIDFIAIKIMIFDLGIPVKGWAAYNISTVTIAPLLVVVSLFMLFKIKKCVNKK